jgi:hypothetical protein
MPYNAQIDKLTAPMAPQRPKILSGLFRHLKWSKNEEDSLHEVFPFNFVVSGSTIRTLVLQT